MIRMFGIKNCDTVKKAQKWFQQQAIAFEFVDFRAEGIEQQQIQQWLTELGAAAVINKRSTTYRNLNDTQKAQLETERAAELLQEHPTLIKRPVLEHDNGSLVGFNVAKYESIFAGKE